MQTESDHERSCKRFQVFLMMTLPSEQTARFFKTKNGTLVSRQLDLTPEELAREVELFGRNMRYVGTWPAFLIGFLGIGASIYFFMNSQWLAGGAGLAISLTLSSAMFGLKIRKNSRLFARVKEQVYRDEVTRTRG